MLELAARLARRKTGRCLHAIGFLPFKPRHSLVSEN